MSHLGEHLRDVRRGEIVTVLDRSTPVARLVFVARPGEPLVIRPARQGAGAPGRVSLPPRLEPPADVVALLWRECRGEDLVFATCDGALGLGARASGVPVLGVPG